jgi:hypothetical protein
MRHRRRPAGVLLAIVGWLAACAADPSDATPSSTTTAATSTTAAPAVAAVSTSAAGGDAGAVDPALCPTVQAWSDASVDAVRDFAQASRTLEPAGRRARYAQAFADQSALHDRLAMAVGRLAMPEAVRAGLTAALASVDATIREGADEAAALPDAAYTTIAVRDGKLLVGTEKSKAIIFNTLADLADAGVPRGCGRRGALDLSPSVTFPP